MTRFVLASSCAAFVGLAAFVSCGGDAGRTSENAAADAAPVTQSRAMGGVPMASGTGGASNPNGSGGAPMATGMGGVAVSIAAKGAAVVFPASAPWYQDISAAGLDPESNAAIMGVAAKGGFGSTQIDLSIEVLHADAAVMPRPFAKTGDFYDPDCDFQPVPVPPGGRLEGRPDYACPGDEDCHLIVLQGTKLFEMWRANIMGGQAVGGTFRGGCLAIWDTARDYWKVGPPPAPFARGDQCTSADAAGYPIAPLLFTPDEVKAGEIKHAVRFILPNNRIRKGVYVHPATHSGAGKGTPTADTIPYGARLRLKAGFDEMKLPTAGARVLARAFKKYGMFLADGGNLFLTGQADTYAQTKWQGLLGVRDLSMLTINDFEMVDGGPRIPLTLDCKRAP